MKIRYLLCVYEYIAVCSYCRDR